MPIVTPGSSCPQGYSHRLAFAGGARFCPGCRAPLERAEPAPRSRAGGPARPAYEWSPTVSVPLGAGDGTCDADTTRDGLSRFVAWRNFAAGVLDTTEGPTAVLVRFPGPAALPAAAAPPAPPAPPVAGQKPELWTLLLEAAPRRAGRLLSTAQAEPAVVQGLVLIALRSRLLAIDLFAREPEAVTVLRLEAGLGFAGCVHARGDDLLAVLRSATGPRVVALQPARDEAGVISLKAEWAWKAAPAEAAPGTFDARPFVGFRRAVFVGDAVFLPGKDAVFVATLTPYRDSARDRPDPGPGEEPAPAGGARWVWRRQDLLPGQRSFADARFVQALGDAGEDGTAAGPTAGHNDPPGPDYDDYGDGPDAEGGDPAGAAAPAGRVAASAGVLVKTIDSKDEPAWSLLRPEADGRLTFRLYPEPEVIVAGGRIFALGRRSHLTEVQESDDVGGPRSTRVAVTGAAVDRLLPVRDDLLAVVRDGQALKVWAYNRVGTLRGRAEGGQKLLGEGEALCPPLLMDDRALCLWTDSAGIFVASAVLPPA